jgi:hypothetical protein
MKSCFKCGTEWKGAGKPGRRDACVRCGADLHVCLNCSFYDPVKPRQCRNDNVELVRDKDLTNFCDEFAFSERQASAPPAGGKPAQPRQAWDSLFKK